MANKKVTKRAVDKATFTSYVHGRGMTIAQIASAIGLHERTMRRALASGYFSFEVTIDIAKYLGDDFTTIFGPDLSKDWGDFVASLQNYVR